MYKCGNCRQEFEKLKLVNGILDCCPICGDNRYLTIIESVVKVEIKPVEIKPIEKKPVVDLDLNKDGNVDKKDLSIAGRFLRSNRKKR